MLQFDAPRNTLSASVAALVIDLRTRRKVQNFHKPQPDGHRVHFSGAQKIPKHSQMILDFALMQKLCLQ